MARKPQISTEVNPGLQAVIDQRVQTEGISRSILMRKALMHYLSVDANGRPLGRKR